MHRSPTSCLRSETTSLRRVSGWIHVGVVLDPFPQLVRVLAHAEEPVLLLDPDDRLPGLGTHPVHQILLRPEALGGRAVPALVEVLVEVALILEALERRLHGLRVPRLRRADEVVVGDRQALPQLLEALDELVGVRLGREPPRLRRLHDLQAVLVGAGEEGDLASAQPVPAREHVRDDRRVRVPEVGLVVHVVDGRRDVEPVAHGNLGGMRYRRPPMGAKGLRLAFVAVVALAVLPLWIVKYVPMVDLPQHLAQADMWVKMGDPAWRWRDLFVLNYFTPYLLGYVIVRAVAVVSSLDVGFRVLLTAIVVAFPLAMRFLLARSRAPIELALLAMPACFGFCWSYGFVNYLLAVPMALVGVALVTDERPMTLRRGMLVAVYVTLLFFTHVLAWGFVGLVGGCVALRRSWRDPRSLAASLLAMAASVPFAVAWMGFGRENPLHDTPALWVIQPLIRLLYMPGAWVGQVYALDIPRTLVGVALAMLPLLLGYRVRRESPMFVATLVALALYLFLPMRILGTFFVFDRFSVFVLPLFYASLAPPPVARFAAWPILMVGPWLLYQGWGAVQFDREARELDPILAAMPDGHRISGVVTAAHSEGAPGPVLWHLARALPDRQGRDLRAELRRVLRGDRPVRRPRERERPVRAARRSGRSRLLRRLRRARRAGCPVGERCGRAVLRAAHDLGALGVVGAEVTQRGSCS